MNIIDLNIMAILLERCCNGIGFKLLAHEL